MVRVTGLEPVRRGHTPLKRACLPIPAHSQILALFLRRPIIITLYERIVNNNFTKNIIFIHIKFLDL